MAQEGLQLFGGDWTERKLDGLDQYLRAYAKALSKTKFSRIYIDAFAGTGYRQQREKISNSYPSIFDEELKELSAEQPKKFLDGSAKIALRVKPAFHKFVFIEHDNSKIVELDNLKLEFPDQAISIDIQAGDANKVIRDLCSKWDKNGARGVLFLDPFGMQAEWSTIEAIANTRCIDTWILFPFAANRLMTKSPDDVPQSWRAKLSKLFGTDEWESRFYKHRKVNDFFEGDRTVVDKNLTLQGLGSFYEERLRKIFPIVAPNSRVLESDKGRPLFQFFFAAGNSGKGGEIALRIATHILDNI